jgi:rRNA-processing protein FCF1
MHSTIDYFSSVVITQCCITELYALGPTGQHVVDMAKNFERRKCNHREAIPGDECLTSVVGKYTFLLSMTCGVVLEAR